MFEKLKFALIELDRKENFLTEKIRVKAKKLSKTEAIGETERKDFPLLKGKESLVQADFKGSKGQAFTDMPLEFEGSINDILKLPLEKNSERALFISAFNAVLSHFGECDKTIHCKNEEPEECAKEMTKEVSEKYGDNAIVGIVGYQPAIIENFARKFGAENMRIVDLDPDNINMEKYGIKIWDGETKTIDLFKESDLILATGSTVVNGTISTLTALAADYDKPLYFFGTSVAGAASFLNLERLCFKST